MAFVDFGKKFDELIPFLNESIYDGAFSRDIDRSVLKAAYIEDLKDGKMDIMRSGDSLLVGLRLEWDSRYFRFPCYRITYLNTPFVDTLFENIQSFLRAREVKLAFLRLTTNDPLRYYISKCSGFCLCATKIMFKKSLRESKCIPEMSGTRLGTLTDMTITEKENIVKNIKSMTPHLFKLNRFMADARISFEKAMGVYEEWTTSLIKERPEDIYCLTNRGKDLCSFAAIRIIDRFPKKLALLEIIGTIIKGRNYGMVLLNGTCEKLKRTGVEMIYANTDIGNYVAQNLFFKNGFVPYHSVDEYHCWID